ncbi:MAG: prolyl oligopeptidase family serine peptidase [Porticoccaceae bacterium]|nr:prolyl oligopeptidase family serine peptidase [Porticoccaceae bacterium]
MIFVLQRVSRLSLLIAYLIVASCLSVVVSATEMTMAQPDIEHYGLLPQYRSVSISPDGKHIALIQRKGTQDFFVVRDAKTLRMVGGFNADKYNARHIFFASNNHVILLNSKHKRMAQIRGSFEQANAFVYNLTSQKIKVLLAQTKGLYPAQSLTNIVGLNAATNELYMAAYTGNIYTSFRMDLYRVSLETGRGKVYARGNRNTIDWFVDKRGQVLAREDFDNRESKHQVFSKTSGEWQLIFEKQTSVPETSFQAVSHNGSRLLFEDGLANHTAIFSIELSNGDIQGPIYQREETDISNVITDINRQLVAVKYSGFVPVYDFLEVEDNKIFDLLTSSFSDNSVHYLSHTSDHTQWLILVSGNDGAGAYKIYDRRNNKLLNLMSQYPAVEAIGEIRAVNIKARDGVKIPSILTLPTDTSKRKNLPLIALPHGGPEYHDSLQFHWLAQYLAAKGYMVLQPNFRGSNGFGFALRDSGYGEWGKKMQDDVSDAVAALVKAGYVDPDRVCIMGASYGGYSALAGGAFTPDLYRCVIAVAAVSDLPLMLKTEKYLKGGNHWVISYWENSMGASDIKNLRLISPINAAEKFQAPVLLVHGKHDTVVPIKQSNLMYKALKKAKKDVEFIKLKGEDHWLSDSTTRLQLLDAVNIFLDKHNPARLPELSQ